MAEPAPESPIEHASASPTSSAESAAWERARKRAEENRAFVASHNRYVEEHGAFGEEWRDW